MRQPHPHPTLLSFITMLLWTLQASAGQPNIIYILADDLGWGDLSRNGQEHFETPHMDKLADDGIVFTSHYSGSTVCAPSRCSLMTGMHMGHATIRGNNSTVNKSRIPLEESDLTIAELLKERGYATGGVGKWGMGEVGTEGVPWKQGFDYWFGYLNQRNAHSYFPPFLYENNRKKRLKQNADRTAGQYSHDLIMEKAYSFIRKNREGPFFLYVAVTIPHAELLIPDKYLDRHKGRFEESPYHQPQGTTYRSQSHPRAAFAAMVEKLDSDIGDLRQLLTELGIDKDTLILFASDNGAHHEGGADPEFFDSNGPFRGIKRDLYEGGIHTPFFVTWPGTIEAGQTSEHISAFWDVLPTLAELTGTSPPEGIDGISFLNVLNGKQQEREHPYLYWEYIIRGEARQAVRFGNWKGVRYGVDSPVEVYDLKTDIGETHDLAPSHPELALKAMMLFDEAHAESADFPLN